MLVWPTSDVDRLNELLNHPDIYPYVHGDIEGPLDASVIQAEQIILDAARGAFWFIKLDTGIWEAHTLFPPNSPDTFEAAKEAIAYMQSLPDYQKIVTQGPHSNPRAIRFLEKLGFQYTHTDGMYQNYPLDYYEYI